ncbi:MAG: glycosyltransferase [Butyrivibrio sp.]|nr:glycosyltransferase [Butyrivibrio sp.]
MELEMARNIMDILGTMQDAVKQMQVECAAGNIQQFELLGMDLQDGLAVVREVAVQNILQGSRNRLADACICAMESLKDVRKLALAGNKEETDWKLEYELGAILEEAARQFYYWGIVNEHPEEREKFVDYIANTDAFQILRKPEKERSYFCDLVILIIGYNKLEYTKRCVQSVLENLPKEISYELVLFNHGSNDGTKKYFENIKEAKVINVAVNSVVIGALYRIFSRGRYYLQISNDVIVGVNAIENLFQCVERHPDYGYVVPSTSAISNLQTIPAYYTNQIEFIDFTKKNNVYDEGRHEQRVRLVNPIDIMPSEVLLQMAMDLYESTRCNITPWAFSDDKNSLWMRRHGYKNILAKDAYCHHAGSITINSETNKQEERERMYLAGRQDFMAHYGVDPWGRGVCYEPVLFENWKISPINNAYILGINCGLGSNPLKVKEIMREQGAKDVYLINCVQDERYLQDLKGISDEVHLFSSLPDIIALTRKKRYDYIVMEDANCCKNEKLVQEILNAGIEFGEIAYEEKGTWRIYAR